MIDEVTCLAWFLLAAFLGMVIGALFVGHLWHQAQRADQLQHQQALSKSTSGYE